MEEPEDRKAQDGKGRDADPAISEDLPDKPSQAEGDDDRTVEEIAEQAKKTRE